MTGSLDETYVQKLRDSDDPDQSSLFDYSENDADETTIAVVSKPNDTGILDVTDEYMPELGMPVWALSEFQQLRAGFNDPNPVARHNKAYEKLDLDQTFEGHVECSEEAQRAIDELVSRLRSGENITLVCFEGDDKRCHRHLLLEIIQERL